MLWHPFGGGRVFPNIRKSSFRWAKNNSRASKAMISSESLRDKHLLSLPITNDIQCACTIWQAALNPDATISYLRGWRMALGWKTLNLCCEAILSSSDALNNYVFKFDMKVQLKAIHYASIMWNIWIENNKVWFYPSSIDWMMKNGCYVPE